MSYSNSPSEHHPDFQYGYPTHSYHYISDGSTIGGDESNFWSNSPRSESPSPNVLHTQNQIDTSYQIYANSSCPTSTHYAPYITTYTTISSETGLGPPFVRVVKRRTTANKKERRRTQSINNAYSDLRDCIPNVPADTKLSKVFLNKKESRRTQSINNAYADLRDCIPNVPGDTKLSKICSILWRHHLLTKIRLFGSIYGHIYEVHWGSRSGRRKWWPDNRICIKTLRLATSYISYLTRALETDDTPANFRAELGSLSRKSSSSSSSNSNNLQSHSNNNNCSSSSHGSPKSDSSDETTNSRKAKGRTGWPQHVWALELKQEQAL